MDVGDAPAWVAAFGTAGALGAALWQIRGERRHRVDAERRRRIAEHVAQARLIAAYKGEEDLPEGKQGQSSDQGRTALYLANNSPEPVYSVVAGLVFIQGAGPRTIEESLELNTSQYQRLGPIVIVNILPGGLYRAWLRGTGLDAILSGRPGVEVAFSDRAGTHWVRRSGGRLEELPRSPLEHFLSWGLAAPYDFQVAERVTLPG
jgi:hypothetical protein